jgi:hypothetical protein
MAGRLWWLNPATGEATETVGEPPVNVGWVNDRPVDFMRLFGVNGLAACGYDATVITSGGIGFGQLFRVPVTPRRGHARVIQRPSAGRVIQTPNRARVRQVIP